jgi:hypothetical protein
VPPWSGRCDLNARLQRLTISVDIDYEPGYEHIAAGMLLDVVRRLANDGVEPRRTMPEITALATTP